MSNCSKKAVAEEKKGLQEGASLTEQLLVAKSRVLMHQHYHLQRIFVCVRTKLVILLGETPNLPSPNQHEYSIASLRAQQKTAPVPGGFTCSFKAATAPKKKIQNDAGISQRCWCCMHKSYFFQLQRKAPYIFGTEGLSTCKSQID